MIHEKIAKVEISQVETCIEDIDFFLAKWKDAIDYTIRLTQFFDHYLKGNLPPIWMTQGIRAAMKGIETGYALDPSGSCSMKGTKSCKVCEKWNEQFKRTPEIFKLPESEWKLDEDLKNDKPVSKPKATKSSE